MGHRVYKGDEGADAFLYHRSQLCIRVSDCRRNNINRKRRVKGSAAESHFLYCGHTGYRNDIDKDHVYERGFHDRK